MRLSAVSLALLAAAAIAQPTRAADVKSISRLAFGPDNTLFVADWKDARIHALELAPTAAKGGDTFNITDLTALISKALGVATVEFDDLAARPGGGEVYVAVHHGAKRTPALVAVTADRKVRVIDLKKTKASSVALKNAPDSGYAFWNDIPERSLTVTDMKWWNGELFVAGLSNQDFASTLRRLPYPFKGEGSVSSVEMYHAIHNQNETRAPIRAMTFAQLDGKPHLIAAYTCTPLVTIPLDALKHGAHVRGKTIAELGYGNTPASLISYSKSDQGKTSDYLLLVNYERSSNVIPVEQIQAANAKPGLDKPVNIGAIAGLEPMQAPLGGVIRADNLDDKFFVTVRRELKTGRTQLVTYDKNMAFRLSDFVSEYNFPNYAYNDPWQRTYLKPVQDMLKRQEGFPADIKP